MRNVYITSPSFAHATVVYDALKEVPHNGNRLAVVDWGHEPLVPAQRSDHWIVVASQLGEDAALPERFYHFHFGQLPAAWNGLLAYLGLSGTHCQLRAGLELLSRVADGEDLAGGHISPPEQP